MGKLNLTASVSFVFGICLLLFVSGTFTQARGATYTVNTNADNTTPDNFLTLREAILMGKGGTQDDYIPQRGLGRCLTNAERRLVSGMCYTRTSNRFGSGCWDTVPCRNGWDINRHATDPDVIVFTDAVTTILLGAVLPAVGLTDSIDGMKPDGSKVTIDGSSAGSSANGLTLYLDPEQPTYDICHWRFDKYIGDRITTTNRITNLIITNFGGHGIEGVGVQRTVFQGLEISRNGGSGIFLHSVRCGSRGDIISHSNLIGGTDPAQRNFIFSNRGHGIDLNFDPTVSLNPASHNNRIEGNFIGSGRPPGGAGLGLLNNGNTLTGVHLRNVRGSVVGGDDPAMSNLAFNMADGVTVSSSTGNRILSNSIFSNARLGINLFNNPESSNHVTANDQGDTDVGSNNLQNSPVLSAVNSAGGTTRIRGTLTSSPSATFKTEFFVNPTCDASGSGEGQTFIASDIGATDANGNRSIDVSVNRVVREQGWAATTTNLATGDTSEFSTCLVPKIDPLRPVVIAPPPIDVPPLCRGVNYALASNGGVATASSNTTANFPPSAANNGDRRGLDFGGGEGKGTWGSQASQPQWLQIILMA